MNNVNNSNVASISEWRNYQAPCSIWFDGVAGCRLPVVASQIL